jgi:proteasome assembly chaperone (PAC2) family protein
MLMNDSVEMWDKSTAKEVYMIAGWHQWADGGEVSSGLPNYLAVQTMAKKIGRIKPEGFYLFQIPGTHHFLRPEITLEDGYRKSLTVRKNEFYFDGGQEKGLVLFVGDEPHLDMDRYTEAFFDVVLELGVRRVGIVGGVVGPVPYDKEREISCVYSHPHMKQELAEYVVKFSSYEGGVSIGTYMVQEAEARGVEAFSLYALVPAYNFSPLSTTFQGVRIERDYKAWYDLMRRLNRMFRLGIDLSELKTQSAALVSSMDAEIGEIQEQMPGVDVKEYLKNVNDEFTEMPFMPLDDVWERELGDILDDLDE